MTFVFHKVLILDAPISGTVRACERTHHLRSHRAEKKRRNIRVELCSICRVNSAAGHNKQNRPARVRVPASRENLCPLRTPEHQTETPLPTTRRSRGVLCPEPQRTHRDVPLATPVCGRRNISTSLIVDSFHAVGCCSRNSPSRNCFRGRTAIIALRFLAVKTQTRCLIL